MLNPNSIYRKTEAGVAEIQARALGLRAELRRLLILIDGTAPIERLAAFVRGSEVDFLLAELETQGLIAPVSMASPPGIGVAIGRGAVGLAPSPFRANANGSLTNPISGDGLPEPTAAQVMAVRREAIRVLHDILGPAADRLAIRIENCKDAQQIRTTINEVRQILNQQVGATAGKRFIDAVRGAAEGIR